MARKILSGRNVGMATAAVVAAVVGYSLYDPTPKAGFVKEPKTGMLFEETTEKLEVLGVGVRVKKIGPIPVKVYAVGIYSFGRLRGDLEKIRTAGRRLLKLKFAMGVGGKTIVDALASVRYSA